MQETKQCKKNENDLYMKSATGVPAATADREATNDSQ